MNYKSDQLIKVFYLNLESSYTSEDLPFNWFKWTLNARLQKVHRNSFRIIKKFYHAHGFSED